MPLAGAAGAFLGIIDPQARDVGFAFIGHVGEHPGGVRIGRRGGKATALVDSPLDVADELVVIHVEAPPGHKAKDAAGSPP